MRQYFVSQQQQTRSRGTRTVVPRAGRPPAQLAQRQGARRASGDRQRAKDWAHDGSRNGRCAAVRIRHRSRRHTQRTIVARPSAGGGQSRCQEALRGFHPRRRPWCAALSTEEMPADPRGTLGLLGLMICLYLLLLCCLLLTRLCPRPCHSRGRPRAGHNDVAYNNRSADGSTAGRKIISPNIDEMADTGIKLLHYCEPRQSSFPPSSPTLNAAAAQPQQTDSNPCCCCCVCCCAQTCSRSARRLARLS